MIFLNTYIIYSIYSGNQSVIIIHWKSKYKISLRKIKEMTGYPNIETKNKYI